MHVQWQLVLYETLELLLPPQLVYSTCASIYCCIQYIHLYVLSLHLVCIIYVSIVSTPGMIYVCLCCSQHLAVSARVFAAHYHI
jgi:hypothetical protein